MAVTVSLTADASGAEATVRQFQTNITQALAGIDAKMQDTARKTGQTTEAWRTSLTTMSQATVKLVAPQQDLSKAVLQTGRAAETQVSSFDKLRAQYRQTEQATKSVTGQMSSLVGSMKGLAAAAGISFSIASLVGLTKDIIEAGIAHDRLMLSLKGALGTAQAAGEAYAFVEGVANRLGIGLVTAVEGFAKLSAATQGTVVQGQQTRDLFVAISEASRVMGLTSAETGGIVTALTQIIGKNTVSMEELRQQLGERLPSALRLTAKEMGVTTSRFIEMVSKGEVLAVDFIPAITRAMTQMGKEAPAAAQSVQAALERVGNAWLTLKVTIAQSGVLELVARIAEEMTRVINLTTNWINRTKRMAGEMGLAPMVAEMQRVTQEIQMWQELANDPNQFGPVIDQANAAIKAREAERDALSKRIEVQQKATEIDEKARSTSEAQVKSEIDRQAAEDKRLETLRKASAAYTGLEDDIKGVVTQLEALRSRDIPSLEVMGLRPDDPGLEQRVQQRETALLKQHQDLLNKRAGISKNAGVREAQEAGQSAIEVARAREEALSTGLKRETLLIQQAAQERLRVIDETAATGLKTGGPSNVEAIEQTRQQGRLKVAIDTAQAIEKIELDTLTKQEAIRERILQAEIAAAGKNLSAATKAQEELTNLHADMENERADIIKKRVAVEQQLSKKSVDEQIKDARELNRLIQEVEQDRIQSRIDIVDEQIALVEAQMDGEVVTVQEGQARIRALQQERFQGIESLYQRQADAAVAAIDAEVQATEIGQAQIARIYQQRDDKIEALQLQQQTQTQRALNEQAQAYEELAKGISSTMSEVFEDLFNGTLELGESIKRWFIRLLADMAAYAATHAIVLPIISAVLGGTGGVGQAVAGAVGLAGAVAGQGGGGGGTGGSLADTGGTVLTGAGLANKAMNAFGLKVDVLSGGLEVLKKGVVGAAQSVADLANAFKFGTSTVTESAISTSTAMDAAIPGTVPAGTGATGAGAVTAGQVLGAAGGVLSIGAGIYGAIQASNSASRAAFAASAAAGAVATAAAAYGAITGGALVIAGTTGWTGVGLIVAAVMAVIGVVLDRVIKPEGPTLAVGGPGGMNIGTADGRLQVQGGVGANVFRRDDVSPALAQSVATQMEAGITSAVISIVETINTVALDPAALARPAQDALQTVLRRVQALNSSNAKKMEQDITEQLKFINVQIVAGMLEPVNLAFDQLRDMGTLQEQIQRLPETTQGLVEIFKGMNTQLDELGKVQNTDVLRQLSAVRNQVENFGNRIAGTAAQTAERIVDGLIGMFETRSRTLTGFESTEGAISDLDRAVANQIIEFSTSIQAALQVRGRLQATQRTLEQAGLPGGIASQVDRLSMALSAAAGRISTQIVSGSLRSLAADLDTILVQPLRVQATTVSTLFNSAMGALQVLGTEWQRLSAEGIDTAAIQGQFSRLVGGLLDTVSTVLAEAFAGGDLGEFLAVLGSIPEAVTNLNPVWAQLRQLGTVVAQVVGPMVQVIQTTLTDLMSPVERFLDVTTRIEELGQAIAQTGGAIDQALPLFHQLAQAVQVSAQAQIDGVNETAEARTQAIQDEYDRALQIIQVWADTETQAINDFTEAATTQFNTFFDSYTDAVNDAFDVQREAWDRWAEDMLAGLTAFVDASTTMINAWAERANTLAGNVQTLADTTRGELSPVAQRAELEGRKRVFEAQARGGGPGADAAMTELIKINTDLLNLAKGGNNLAQVQKSLDELRSLQKIQTDRLIQETGESDPVLAQIKVGIVQRDYLKSIDEYQKAQTDYITTTQQAAIEALEQRRQDHLDTLEVLRARVQEGFEMARNVKLDEIEATRTTLEEQLAADRDQKLAEVVIWQAETVKAIKVDMVYHLQLIQDELRKMFAMQYTALTGMSLAPQAAQQGGLLAFASINRAMTGPLALATGGQVQAMLEPGERVFTPPMSHVQQGALMAMNTAFPRFAGGGFTVPGSGTGDSVPALVPSGSFVLNRRASGALGFQGGGTVQGGTSREPTVVHHHHYYDQRVDLRGIQIRSHQDLEELKRALAELRRRGLRP